MKFIIDRYHCFGFHQARLFFAPSLLNPFFCQFYSILIFNFVFFNHDVTSVRRPPQQGTAFSHAYRCCVSPCWWLIVDWDEGMLRVVVKMKILFSRCSLLRLTIYFPVVALTLAQLLPIFSCFASEFLCFFWFVFCCLILLLGLVVWHKGKGRFLWMRQEKNIVKTLDVQKFENFWHWMLFPTHNIHKLFKL